MSTQAIVDYLQTAKMVRQRKYMILAKAMLEALQKDFDKPADQVNFPNQPEFLRLPEQALIAALREENEIGPQDPAHVEYGCLEHGVVHVYATLDTDDKAHCWITIQPETGELSKQQDYET